MEDANGTLFLENILSVSPGLRLRRSQGPLELAIYPGHRFDFFRSTGK